MAGSWRDPASACRPSRSGLLEEVAAVRQTRSARRSGRVVRYRVLRRSFAIIIEADVECRRCRSRSPAARHRPSRHRTIRWTSPTAGTTTGPPGWPGRSPSRQRPPPWAGGCCNGSCLLPWMTSHADRATKIERANASRLTRWCISAPVYKAVPKIATKASREKAIWRRASGRPLKRRMLSPGHDASRQRTAWRTRRRSRRAERDRTVRTPGWRCRPRRWQATTTGARHSRGRGARNSRKWRRSATTPRRWSGTGFLRSARSCMHPCSHACRTTMAGTIDTATSGIASTARRFVPIFSVSSPRPVTASAATSPSRPIFPHRYRN